jgi:hypothetical protein
MRFRQSPDIQTAVLRPDRRLLVPRYPPDISVALKALPTLMCRAILVDCFAVVSRGENRALLPPFSQRECLRRAHSFPGTLHVGECSFPGPRIIRADRSCFIWLIQL